MNIMFQDRQFAARHLEHLFVPGLQLTGHIDILALADILHARGLMLSTAQCPSVDAAFYVHLRELTAAPSSFASLFEKCISARSCSVCSDCCVGGLAADEKYSCSAAGRGCCALLPIL